MSKTFSVTRLVIISTAFASMLAAADGVPASPGAGVKANGPAPLYVLGPDDLVVVNGLNAEDVVNKPMRIDGKGDVSFPLIGTVHAGGLTIPEFEVLLNKRMSVFVKNPQLVVTVTEYRSQPVSVLGAVNTPGIHQIQGRKNVVEMISLAGGLRSDAGSTITMTRAIENGRLPLPNEHLDSTGKYSTADVSLTEITQGLRPDENIQIMPHDVLSVSRARTVYVIGEVKKAGGFAIGDENAMSVIQALSMAEGPDKTADLKKALVIRNSQVPGKRQEIACDLTKMLNGKTPDVPLQPQDILYIPGNTGKKVALKALETAVTTGSGIAIWSVR